MATPSMFHLFPLFPTELRLEIWRFGALTPSSSLSAVYTPSASSTPTVTEIKNTSLLSTSREARQAALQPSSQRPYNPATDIVYSPDVEIWHYQCKGWAPEIATGLGKEVRHLAIHLPNLGIPTVALMLRHLLALQSITIVYPTTPSGAPQPYTNFGAGRRDSNFPPMWNGKALRLLETLDESDASTDRDYMRKIRSFYMVMPNKRPFRSSDLARPRPIDRRYAAMDADERNKLIAEEITEGIETRRGGSVKDQLAYFECMLNKEVLLGNTPVAWIMCWDHVEGGLKLRYEARCFAT
jgi:hypothetical protein